MEWKDRYTFKDREVWDTFVQPGEVVELRVFVNEPKGPWEGFAKGGNVFGFFDDHDQFVEALKSLRDVSYSGAYYTLHPIDPRLLGRAFNRLKAAIKDSCTSNNNVIAFRWLPIDIDVNRPMGVSTSDEEHELALRIGREIMEYAKTTLHFPGPMLADSGNGAHVLCRLPDLDPGKPVQQLIARVLDFLNEKFGGEKIKIDQAVSNPGRIWKCYGTFARKGDEVTAGNYREARPHRRSAILSLGGHAAIDDDGVKRLELMFPPPPPETPSRRPANGGNGSGKLDLKAYLDHYGVQFKQFLNDGTWEYKLRHCVFDESHEYPDAMICQRDDGQLTYHCFHDSCQGKKWKDARTVISGDDKLGKFIREGR